MNSSSSSRPDKRQRLIEAAQRLFFHQGCGATSLAEVATEADVPLGNVYYYFKTKDALIEAVIEQRLSEIKTRLEDSSRQTTPDARITDLLASFAASAEEISRHGCRFNTLVQELDRRGGELAEKAGEILTRQRSWLEHQFTEMGFADRASELALEFLAGIEGTMVLSFAFRDPHLVSRVFKSLETRLDQLLAEAASQASPHS